MILQEFIKQVLLEKRSEDYWHLFDKILDTLKDRYPINSLRQAIYVINSYGGSQIQIDLFALEDLLTPEDFTKFHADLPLIADRYGWHILLEDQGKVALAPKQTKQETQIPKYLYHVTPTQNLLKILKRGLQPKLARKIGNAAKRSYAPRVYLALNKLAAMELWSSFRYQFSDDDTKYTLLIIDTGKLRKGTKLYNDTEDPEAVWTSSPIPVDALVDYKDLT